MLNEEPQAMDVGCVATDSTYFVGAYTRFDKLGAQSMHYDPDHPSLRSPFGENYKSTNHPQGGVYY